MNLGNELLLNYTNIYITLRYVIIISDEVGIAIGISTYINP